jgi:hypothetical protein
LHETKQPKTATLMLHCWQNFHQRHAIAKRD